MTRPGGFAETGKKKESKGSGRGKKWRRLGPSSRAAPHGGLPERSGTAFPN